MFQNNNRLTCVGTAEIKGDCRGRWLRDKKKTAARDGRDETLLVKEGGCNKDQTWSGDKKQG